MFEAFRFPFGNINVKRICLCLYIYTLAKCYCSLYCFVLYQADAVLSLRFFFLRVICVFFPNIFKTVYGLKPFPIEIIECSFGILVIEH